MISISHTRYDINNRTTHTIYLNSLSTTGQKILEHLQDHSTNSGFPQFKHKAPMINPVKGRIEINLTSINDVQKSITGTQTLSV